MVRGSTWFGGPLEFRVEDLHCEYELKDGRGDLYFPSTRYGMFGGGGLSL